VNDIMKKKDGWESSCHFLGGDSEEIGSKGKD
jgi:hypothetical protein